MATHPQTISRRAVFFLVCIGWLVTLWLAEWAIGFPETLAEESSRSLSGENLDLQADQITLTDEGRILSAEGSVEVSSSGFHLTADRIRLDAEQHRLHAEGRVRLIHRGVQTEADSLGVSLSQNHLVLVNARIRVHSRGDSRSGQGFVFSAQRVEGGKAGRWKARSCRFSPCICEDDQEPPLRLDATEAQIRENDQARITSPVIRLHDIPVFMLPSATVPLARRKAGLTPPELSHTGRNGLGLGAGYFLPTGDEADLTPGLRWFSERGVEPHLRTRANTGELTLNLDSAYLRDWSVDSSQPRVSDRFHLEGEEQWKIHPRLSQKLALNLSRDDAWSQDFAERLSDRLADPKHSLLALEYTGRALQASLSARWEQDPRQSSRADGDFWRASENGSIHHLPSSQLNLIRQSLLDGRVNHSLHLGLTSFMQTGVGETPGTAPGFDTTKTTEELPLSPQSSPSNEKALRAVRMDWRYQLRSPWTPAQGLLIEPHAFLSGKSFFFPQATERPQSDIVTDLGASSRLSLFRVFHGDKESALLHRIIPEIEYHVIPWMNHEPSANPDIERLSVDPLDSRIRPHRLHVRLSQEFSLRHGSYAQKPSWRFLRWTLEQVIALPHPKESTSRRLEPIQTDLRFHFQESSLTALVAYDWQRQRLAHGQSRFVLGRLWGLGLDGSYWYAPRGTLLSDWTLQRQDALERTLHQVNAGPSWVIKQRWRLHYHINLNLAPVNLYEQRFGVAYTSACQCFFVTLDAALRPSMQAPDFFVRLGLGSW